MSCRLSSFTSLFRSWRWSPWSGRQRRSRGSLRRATRRAGPYPRLPGATRTCRALGRPLGPHRWNDQKSIRKRDAERRRGRSNPIRIRSRDEQLLRAEARRTVAGGNVGSYNNFWNDKGARSNRTSMLVDPPDGRFSAANAWGRDREEQPTPWRRLVGGPAHLGTVCHARGMPNAMFPRVYNNNVQII